LQDFEIEALDQVAEVLALGRQELEVCAAFSLGYAWWKVFVLMNKVI
jgi:hypothetical protein